MLTTKLLEQRRHEDQNFSKMKEDILISYHTAKKLIVHIKIANKHVRHIFFFGFHCTEYLE